MTRRTRSVPRVILYSRTDCGLCVEAEVLLRELREDIGFTLEVINVDREPALLSRYWAAVPVVAVDGEDVAWAPLEKGRLRRLLER